MCLVVLAGICCEVVPCQSLGVRTVARLEVAKKYEIKEDFMHSLCMECCCCCCSTWQVQNEIILKEGLKYGCVKLVKDDNPKEVAPVQTEMQR